MRIFFRDTDEKLREAEAEYSHISTHQEVYKTKSLLKDAGVSVMPKTAILGLVVGGKTN